jgi:hypothetical protein
MASLINRLADKLDLMRHEDLLYGRVNDIFINLRFIKHIRNSQNANLIEFLVQPKYDRILMEVYVSKKASFDIQELSGFFELQYADYKTTLPEYFNGRFMFSLYQYDALNVKAWYVIGFLNTLTEFLNECGYFSSCLKCGGNDGISYIYDKGKVTEVCTPCLMKEAKL